MSASRNVIIGIIFGLGAGLAYGVSSVLIRQGVAAMAPPLVGAALAMLSGTLGLAIVGTRNFARVNLVRNKKPIVFLLMSGVAASLGSVSNYFALSMAPVVIVSPLEAISPLFTLFWSYLFLRHLERVTLRLILGTLLVVGGVILIILGRMI